MPLPRRRAKAKRYANTGATAAGHPHGPGGDADAPDEALPGRAERNPQTLDVEAAAAAGHPHGPDDAAKYIVLPRTEVRGAGP